MMWANNENVYTGDLPENYNYAESEFYVKEV